MGFDFKNQNLNYYYYYYCKNWTKTWPGVPGYFFRFQTMLNSFKELEVLHKSQEKTARVAWVWSYTGWDFFFKPAKKWISIQQGVKSENHQNSLSFTLSFLFHERLHCCCYIDFHCYCLYSYHNSSWTLCIKCWDSAFRTEFQHFILRFNKISLLHGYH